MLSSDIKAKLALSKFKCSLTSLNDSDSELRGFQPPGMRQGHSEG